MENNVRSITLTPDNVDKFADKLVAAKNSGDDAFDFEGTTVPVQVAEHALGSIVERLMKATIASIVRDLIGGIIEDVEAESKKRTDSTVH